jgi:Domain of unknown function (DUF1990)
VGSVRQAPRRVAVGGGRGRRRGWRLVVGGVDHRRFSFVEAGYVGNDDPVSTSGGGEDPGDFDAAGVLRQKLAGRARAVCTRAPAQAAQGAIWSRSAAPCRVVCVVDEAGPTSKFGFAYGTLPGHVESGEERFLILAGDQQHRTPGGELVLFAHSNDFCVVPRAESSDSSSDAGH